MSRDELIFGVAVLVSDYRGWDVPEDYLSEATTMVEALEREAT